MGLLFRISWEMPDFYPPDELPETLGAYDNEAHVIHLNRRELAGSPLLLFRMFIHELLHHVVSSARNRGRIDLDGPRWRFLTRVF